MIWEDIMKLLDEEIAHIHKIIMEQKTGAENILKLAQAMGTIVAIRERNF